jgi:hypothetical protein
MSMKNSNNTIGNGTRDYPVCSGMPQPTALTRGWKFCDKQITQSVCREILNRITEAVKSEILNLQRAVASKKMKRKEDN